MANKLPRASVLGEFLSNIDTVRQQIRDDKVSRKDNAEFDQDSFWEKMDKMFKMLSHEATKMSLAFSSDPLPSEKNCAGLVASAEKSTLALISVYYSLPKSQGLRLHRSTKAAVLSMLDDMHEFIHSILNDQSGSQERLQTTGTVWQNAELFSSLPKSNRDVVVKEMVDSAGLVKDALEELEEAVENGGPTDELVGMLGEDDDEEEQETEHKWTEVDLNVVKPCVGLIKTTKSLLKKSKECVHKNGKLSGMQEMKQLDDLAELMERLSPAVDDVILDLYPPMSKIKVQEKCQSVFNIQNTVLEFLRSSHLSGEDEEKWIEFLLKANRHNWENVLKQTDAL